MKMVKKSKIKRIIGYCRCSTAEQSTEGYSLDVQRSKITAYCELNDLNIVDIVEDAGFSGKSLDRPGIQDVLKRLRNDEADTLVILKLDRLSRSTRDVLHMVELIERHNWELHSIAERLDTSSASGRFTISLLSSLAQLEAEVLSERTSSALKFKKQNGERLGTTPLGYLTVEENGERKLTPCPEEQLILGRIVELRNGGMSLEKIAGLFNQENVPSKRGGKWFASTVKYLLQNIIPRTIFV